MRDVGCHDNYPGWMVPVSNLVQLSIYGIGAVLVGSLVWLIAPCGEPFSSNIWTARKPQKALNY